MILGVDLGKVMGFCDFDGKPLDFEFVKLHGEMLEERCNRLFSHLLLRFKTRDYELVAIEQPPMVRNPVVYRQLVHYEATVFRACEDALRPYVSFQNQEIKKWFTGKGNASKEAVVEELQKRKFLTTKPEFQTKKEGDLWQNAYDAIMIAAYGEWWLKKGGQCSGEKTTL